MSLGFHTTKFIGIWLQIFEVSCYKLHKGVAINSQAPMPSIYQGSDHLSSGTHTKVHC